MVRMARLVIPGYPHHIAQRGNRRQDVFFRVEDYQEYLNLIRYWCREEGVAILSYCLLNDCVHLVVKPDEGSNLSKAIGETHRRYTRSINSRKGWKGYLWQGRFSSFPMDEMYLLKAMAYVELNPVREKLVAVAWDHPWSSVHAHVANKSDGIVEVEPLVNTVGNWKAYLSSMADSSTELFERHGRTGRPLGDEPFIDKICRYTGRDLKPKKRGPKTKRT